MTDKITAVLTPDPMGFRDLYWCWNLNEPFIIEYQRNKPFCPNCNALDVDALMDEQPIKLSEEFKTNHTFICHISLPKRKKINES